MKIGLIHSLKHIFGKNLIALFYRSLFFLSDEQYVKTIFRLRVGRSLDLKDPKTFNDKLNWLKLHDRKPLYHRMADKLALRDYVRDHIGEGHSPEVLGIWGSFDEIDFESLPDRFVIKTNHDSGSYAICTDKATFDRRKARKTIRRSLARNYYRTTREWQYDGIEPKVFAEELIGDGSPLTDYKVFCFNGQPRFMYMEQESVENPVQAIVDMDYNRLEFTMEDGRAEYLPPRPECFDTMVEFSRELSKDAPFQRVDMYCVDGKVYISELTFYHYGGYIPFDPESWDLKIGQMLDISGVEGD